MKRAALLAILPSLLIPAVAYADEDDEYYEEEEEEEVEAPPPRARAKRRARADDYERPPSGVPFLISGGIITGIGGVNLLTAPLCRTDLVDEPYQDECLISSLVVGGVFLAVGIPLLAVGGVQRSKYVEWRARHRGFVDFDVAPVVGGATLRWSTEL
jgi:hypothetical protein